MIPHWRTQRIRILRKLQRTRTKPFDESWPRAVAVARAATRLVNMNAARSVGVKVDDSIVVWLSHALIQQFANEGLLWPPRDEGYVIPNPVDITCVDHYALEWWRTFYKNMPGYVSTELNAEANHRQKLRSLVK